MIEMAAMYLKNQEIAETQETPKRSVPIVIIEITEISKKHRTAMTLNSFIICSKHFTRSTF